MTTQVQFRRGTTAEHDTFTGAVGEVTVDTDLKTLKVHDGSNPGGTRIATFSNIAEQTHTFSDESSTSLTVTPGTSDIKLVGSGGISVVILFSSSGRIKLPFLDRSNKIFFILFKYKSKIFI